MTFTVQLPPPPTDMGITNDAESLVSRPWMEWFYRLANLVANGASDSSESIQSVSVFTQKELTSQLVYRQVEDQNILATQIFGG